MNGVDVSGAVASSSVSPWLPILIAVAVVAVIAFVPMESSDRLPVSFLVIGIALVGGALMTRGGVGAEESKVRAMIGEYYQVDYGDNIPLPKNGGSVDVSLEGKSDDNGVLILYRNVVAKRSEGDIVTLWVPKEEGSIEFVELGSEPGASEYKTKQ